MTVHELALECPQCKKTGLVRLHDDSETFECVYCRHKEDLSQPSNNSSGFAFTALLAILVTLLLLGV